MASMFKLPGQQVVDGNGSPYSGAKLYFYAAGTTTPQSTYSDNALSVVQSNPVVADSAGRFDAIYMTGLNYRIQLRTSADVLIEDWDNVDPGSPLTSGTLAVSLGGTGATTASGARTNLGLGTAATRNVGTAADQVVALDGSGNLPAVPGVNLTSVPAATQAEQEAASNTAKAVTPGRQQFHPSAAKFWAYVVVTAGVPALTSNYNVTSITDTGVGVLTITIATDFSSADWCALATCDTANRDVFITARAAGTVEVTVTNNANAAIDPGAYNVVGFGDQ